MYDSMLGRMLGVLVRPQPTFVAVLREPRWWPPVAAVTLAGVLMSSAVAAGLDVEEIVRAAGERSGREVAPEDLDAMVAVYRGWLVLGWCVPPLAMVLVAGRAFATLSDPVLFGRVSHKDPALRAVCRSIVAHALMPLAVFELLAWVLLRAGRPVDLDVLRRGTLVPTSLASLLPADAPLPLFGLLAGFDVFAAWIVLLLVTGFSIARLMPAGRALAGGLALWSSYVLARVVTAFFGG